MPMFTIRGNGKEQGIAMTDLREQIAALSHEQWAGWTEWMLHRLTPENIARWRRQINTPYSELSEEEKDSDRIEADKILALIPKPTVKIVCEKCRSCPEDGQMWDGECGCHHDPCGCDIQMVPCTCKDGMADHEVIWEQELDMGGVDPQNRPYIAGISIPLTLPDLLDADVALIFGQISRETVLQNAGARIPNGKGMLRIGGAVKP